jgi:hypothetical protein
MRWRWYHVQGTVIMLVIALSRPAFGHDAGGPLFASDDILKLRIEAPFDDLIHSAPHATTPYDATITLLTPNPETHSIRLSARGVSRRDPATCYFPPLRIEFKEKPAADSLFKGQKNLKLSTHCRSDSEFQNYSLLEYTAYKLLNVLTPLSFRVRLGDIEYVEARTGSVRVHRLGFFIEEVGEMAARNGLRDVKATRIERQQLNASAVAVSDLFQYMIGNQDWSDRFPTAGTPCCHNIKLLGAQSNSSDNLIPVAHDFDSSGFVNPPYAAPPPGVPIASVRTRNYRGLCQFNLQATEAAHAVLDKRAELLATIANTPNLSERNKKSATQYLEAFFAEIGDADQLKRHILDNCRN